MVKQLECQSLFHYSWDQLAKAFWKRYPNPHSGHVLSEDTVCREIRGNHLYTKRILTKTQQPPGWGKHLVKTAIVSIVEESYINPADQTITTYTRNIGFNRLMSITEFVVYKPNDVHLNQTLAERTAWVTSQVFGLRRAIESWGIERFRKNCIKAAEGYTYVMQNLYSDASEAPLVQTGTGKSHLSTKFGETKGRIKEKAKRAGEIAKEKAGSIYVVCQDQPTESGAAD